MNRTRIPAAVLAAILTFSAVPAQAFAEEYSVTSQAYASGKLAAPANIKTSAITNSSITLTWKKVSGADGYEIYKYNTKKKKFVKCKTVTTNSCKIGKLTQGTEYRFKVCAIVTKNGKSTRQTMSDEITATTKKGTLSAPKLTVEATSTGCVSLRWNSVKGADKYRIYKMNSSGQYKKYDDYNGTMCIVTGLSDASTYKFKICAISGGKEQKMSDAVSATTNVSYAWTSQDFTNLRNYASVAKSAGELAYDYACRFEKSHSSSDGSNALYYAAQAEDYLTKMYNIMSARGEISFNTGNYTSDGNIYIGNYKESSAALYAYSGIINCKKLEKMTSFSTSDDITEFRKQATNVKCYTDVLNTVCAGLR